MLRGLSTIVAANTKKDFLGPYATAVAATAAIASFLLTALNPQKTAKGYVNRCRYLGKATSRFQFDSSILLKQNLAKQMPRV